MKVNDIKALDYQCQGDSLTLVLTETDFETVSNLNTALVEVRTDDGDLVEAHGGYALRAITYDKDKQTHGIEEFNDFVAHDERVEKVMLPLRDGLTLIYKKHTEP